MATIWVAGLGAKRSCSVTPSMSLASVLEDVVTSQKLTGSSTDYALWYRNKPLDLSLPFRLSGLPANARLEVRRAAGGSSSVSSSVTVALQIEGESRLQGKFSTNASLWHVIRTLEKDFGNLTRREASKPPQKTGMFAKMTHKPGPPVYWQPILTFMQKRLSTLEEMGSTRLHQIGLTSSGLIRLSFTPTDAPLADFLSIMEKLDSEQEQVEVVPAKPAQDDEERRRKIEETKKKMLEEEERKEKAKLVAEERARREEAERWKKKMEDEEKMRKLAEEQRIKREARAKMETEVANEDIAVPIEDETIPKVERCRQVFLPSADSNMSGLDDIPDSFYDHSTADLQHIVSASKRAEQREESEKVLKTRAMRDREDKAKAMSYEKAVIRIRLPASRVEIEGTFHPLEHVHDINTFMRECVQEKERPFHLFITPPVHTPGSNETLWQAGLVPASVMHFKWNDGEISDPALVPELGVPIEPVKPVIYQPSSSSATSLGATAGTTRRTGGSSDASSGSSGSKLPKWFRKL